MGAPAVRPKGGRRRVALLAAVAVALVAFLILRRRSGAGVELVPGAAAGGELDLGAPDDGNMLGAISELTSYTALLESQLGGLQTINEDLSQRVGDLSSRIGELTRPAPPPPPPAPQPSASTAPLPPPHTPPPAAARPPITVFPPSRPIRNPVPGEPWRPQ